MTIEKETLMALKGNLVVGVKTTAIGYTMVDLVRLQKAIDAGVYDRTYDMNNDGYLNQTDYDLLRAIIISGF